MQPHLLVLMPIEIDGTEYLRVSELAEETGVCRQTIWRWRTSGLIPQGHIHRRRGRVFSPTEVEVVKRYALGVEPDLSASDPSQPDLFEVAE